MEGILNCFGDLVFLRHFPVSATRCHPWAVLADTSASAEFNADLWFNIQVIFITN